MTVSGPAGPSVPTGRDAPAPAGPGGRPPPGHGVPPPFAPPPPPPSGPGVTPPFAAPPTEGRSLRLWLGLGAGALVAALCCGGGGAALVGLVVSGGQAINEQARVVVGDYLRAVKDKEFTDAYRLLCDSDQRRESPGEFEDRLSAEPDITSYEVGDAAVSSSVTVPVTITYSGGNQQSQRVTLSQDSGTGRFEVCGIT